jgi:hypothetical protein
MIPYSKVIPAEAGIQSFKIVLDASLSSFVPTLRDYGERIAGMTELF